MNGSHVNRRQFIQLGATTSLLGTVWSAQAHPSAFMLEEPMGGLTTDPFLQLALSSGFADHDLHAWPGSMRMLVRLKASDRAELKRMLGPDLQIQNGLFDPEGAWATVSLNHAALLRWHRQGLNNLFIDHAWGAPWAHGCGMAASASSTHPPLSTGQTGQSEQAWQNHDGTEVTLGLVSRGARHRVLVIDHGFPLQHLQACGVAFQHLASHARNRPEPFSPAASHGAQVLGLLLKNTLIESPHGDVPLMLYELPDALLGSMPRGALWPDVFDAVCWGLRHAEPGQTLWALLSVVSTDGDRGPASFISQSAQALARHALSRGVDLKWIMAAGNSHADQQNLGFELAPGETAIWQWQLPPQNLRASLLECWHSGGDVPRISVQPPGQAWVEAHEAWTLAQRHDPRQGKTQTVMRLAPTMAFDPSTTLARAGTWRVRWDGTDKETLKDTRLDVNLSLMVSHVAGQHRQARLVVDPTSTARSRPPVTLSGLVPHGLGVWVAQTLNPAHAHACAWSPDADQLSAHSGRWPLSHNLGGAQHVGVRVDGSLPLPGVPVISRHGHSTHRASGTSMAVPLALGLLWRDQLG